MSGKRLALARILMKAGLHKARPTVDRASLLVVNFHRIRPSPGSGPSRFDDGVFGPDATVFRRQMEWLKGATQIVDEQGLVELAGNREPARGARFSAVTFDDAYIDCYTTARPILEEFGIRGIFFVPVNMIEARLLGWWDQAAFVLKRSTRASITVRGHALDLSRDFSGALRRVLDMFKLEPADRTDGLLDELSAACGAPLPGKDLQSAELMTWDQIREMQRSGHAIGSHTLSHRVLATLTPERQAVEIRESRRQLMAHLRSEVLSFAYPVGGPQHINATSVALVEEAGYQQAFTFNTGLESLPVQDRFRIRRESAHSFELLQAKVLMPSLMGIRRQQAV